MIIKGHKLQILILFVTSIVFTLLMAVSFWNYGLKANINFGIWPVIFLILCLISSISFFVLHLQSTNPKKINAFIQKKVTEERLKILAEFEKKEEPETETMKGSDIVVEKIVPTGHFKSEESFAKKLLLNLSSKLQASIGIYYNLQEKSKTYRFLTGFALTGNASPPDFKSGENLNGQVAESKQIMILRNVPENYFNIESGAGKSKPRNLLIAPIVNNNRTIAIVEIATFMETDTKTEKIISELCALAAQKIEQIKKS